MKVENDAARNYYMEEAIAQNWSTRALERQINSFYYERIISSKNKKGVIEEEKKETNKLASIDDLKEKLARKILEQSTNTGQTKELQGISFKIQNFKYKGSEIDPKFSVKKS